MVSLHIQYLESSQGPGTNWPTASPQVPVPQRGLLKLPTQGPSSPSQAAVPEDGFTLSVKAGWTCSASHCDNRDVFFGGLRFLLRSPTLCKSLLDGEDPDYWRTWHMVGYFINTGRMNAHGWLSSKHLPSGPAWREGTKPLPHRCFCLSKLSDPVTEKKLEKFKLEPNISLVHSTAQI